MQTPTHILTGLLIERAYQNLHSRPLRFALTSTTALLSHAVLDKFARFTYHPPNPNFQDPFWVCYHAGLVILTIALLRRYWQSAKTGILFANLPDIDWLILHPSRLLGVSIPFWQGSIVHESLYHLINVLPLFPWLETLPSFGHTRSTAFIEVGLIAVLLGYAYLLERRQGSQTNTAGRFGMARSG